MKLIQKLLRQHTPWRFVKKGFLQGLTEHQITNIEKMNSAMDIEASKQKWMEEEDKIKQKIVCFEDSETDLQISLPFTVGGADLSYIPGMVIWVVKFSKEGYKIYLATKVDVWPKINILGGQWNFSIKNITTYFVK